MFHYIIAYIAFVILPVMAYSQQENHHEEQHQGYQIIHTDELRALYEREMQMIVVDARTDKYYSQRRLPNAIRVPHNSSEEFITEVLPSQEGLIVVYCTNVECPASKLLTHRLVAMGYTNVYKYLEGIEGWTDAGLPIVLDD